MTITLRIDPELLEAVDRVRGPQPRGAWLKDRAREAVVAHDGPRSPAEELDVASHAITREQAAAAVGMSEIRVEAGSMLDGREAPVEFEVGGLRRRTPEEISGVTGHRVGCKCLNCDRAGSEVVRDG